MVNVLLGYNVCMPFDKTFFRFVLGFAFILSLSFSVLFFTGMYANNSASALDAVNDYNSSDFSDSYNPF